MKLIAFTGSMGSGKSTAIECLKELQHNRVENVKFAAPLYDMQENIYRRIASVYERPEGFVKDRKLLQFLGTEWGRDTISKTIWLDIWKTDVMHIAENYPKILIVCDDVRYDNEAILIKQLGGYLIKLESHSNINRIDSNNGIPGHVSELGVDLNFVDFVVENNGTIDDLKTSLLTINEKTSLW